MPAGTAAGSERGALAYWFDIAPEVREQWLDWYQHDHMPSRVGTTFVSGRCYEALHAGLSHMVLFETTEPEALLAPSYVALLRQVSDADRQRRGWYSNTIRVTCHVGARIGKGTGSVLGVVRVAGALANAADVRRCLVEDVVPALARVPRIGAAWLIENDPAWRARMDEAPRTSPKPVMPACCSVKAAAMWRVGRPIVGSFTTLARVGTTAPPARC